MASGQKGNGLIYVGIPRERTYITSFVDNRDRVLATLHEAGRECGFFQAEGHRVDRNRDRIVQNFLQHARRPEWLLMLDSDMEHPVDCGLRLTQWGVKVVGGLYFHRGHHEPVAFYQVDKQEDEYGRLVQMWEPLRDVVYDWLRANRIPMRDGAFVTIRTSPEALTAVDAVGTGCFLVHRSILEVMKPPWFEYRDGSQSEDLEFCQRVREELGEKIYVDLSTVCGHYHTVAMGQAQFRIRHEGRGVSLSSYTPQRAAEWLAEFLEITPDEAAQQLGDYRPQMLGQTWLAVDPQSPEDVRRFYESGKVGRLYLLDLLHWNASPAFDSLRRQVMKTRQQRVLEIGGGIGTLGIQLALQENEVTIIEPNALLRGFTAWRWWWTRERTVSRYGQIQHMPYLTDVTACNYDLVTALDVFEHLPEMALRDTVCRLSERLKVGGRLFCHNNFGQQDIYPMHYDHSHIWSDILTEAGLFPLDDLWSVKI